MELKCSFEVWGDMFTSLLDPWNDSVMSDRAETTSLVGPSSMTH